MASLNPAQLRAVKWYIGDVSGDDPFWGDPKAYLVINSLFFPGTQTERARAAEGKHLNPEILADQERLVSVLRDLLSAFMPLESDAQTFRVERFADYEMLQNAGHTLSFTSTSTAGFLRAYRDRTGIALMQFDLPAGTSCIRMAEMLDTYVKADEAEILLPPMLRVSLETLPLTDVEAEILDASGKPPVISVRAAAQGMVKPGAVPDAPSNGQQAGMRVLSALNAGKTPSEVDEQTYAAWKHHLTGCLLRG